VCVGRRHKSSIVFPRTRSRSRIYAKHSTSRRHMQGNSFPSKQFHGFEAINPIGINVLPVACGFDGCLSHKLPIAWGSFTLFSGASFRKYRDCLTGCICRDLHVSKNRINRSTLDIKVVRRDSSCTVRRRRRDSDFDLSKCRNDA